MSGSIRRAAAATTLIGLVAAVSAGPAQATPPRASAAVVDDVLVISGTNAADRITVDFTALDSVVVDLGHGHVLRLDPRIARRRAAGRSGQKRATTLPSEEPRTTSSRVAPGRTPSWAERAPGRR